MASERRLKIHYTDGDYVLFLDGLMVDSSLYTINYSYEEVEDNPDPDTALKKKYHIGNFKLPFINALNGVRLSDLSDTTFHFGKDFITLPDFCEFYFATFDSDSKTLHLKWSEDLYNWKYSFSPIELIQEIEATYIEKFGIPPTEPIYSQISMKLNDPETDFSNSILNGINELSNIIWRSCEKIKEKEFINKFEFLFPEHLKFACEQYLVYFGQFLSDIGQQVDINITHSGANTLFEVIPEDKNTSLEKIREALNIYLGMSTSNPTTSSTLSLAESRYQAVIVGFQAQVMSLQAQENARQLELQAARLTMAQQQNVIDQQGAFILQQSQTITAQANALAQSNSSINIFAQALKDKEDEQEEALGEVIKVKPFEWGPLVLDVPSALRKVKDIFAKKENSEDGD